MPLDLILGTAGHIDHGKTSLIKALTGVDTDRLPEERKRGITIELGFAELLLGDVRLGIVDVPGHERFVRNMLAGATGIDLALLVVAADDSVKPQTREHLEILRLLDLSAGVIALTKCDLAEPDWIELVEGEVRDLVAGTFLADAPIVRTSAATGRGLEQLRAALEMVAGEAAERARGRARRGPFRMAIDRSFTLAGHGTVVTGSVASGEAHVGDELLLEPGGVEVRVRGLQNHDRAVDEVHRGQRAAINLAGVHHDQIVRGQELTTAGHLLPSRLLTLRLELLASAPRPLKQRARVRLHLGTAELMARVSLLEGPQLEPGGAALAQLFLAEPAVSTWHQPLVIRSESPVITIGGGVVLDPGAPRIRGGDADDVAQAARLAANDPLERASAALYFAGRRQLAARRGAADARDWRPDDLARTAGSDDGAPLAGQLAARGDLVELRLSPTRTLPLHRLVLERVEAQLAKALTRLHAEFPLQRAIEVARLRSAVAWLEPAALLDALLERMAAAGALQRIGPGVALAGHGPQLSKREQQLLSGIVARFREAGFQPPSIDELRNEAERNQAAVPELVRLAAAEGELVQVSDAFFLHRDVEADLRARLRQELASGGRTLSQIRELLGTTRKYAVPICEYLDRVGFTKREGDVRVLEEGG